MAIFDTKTGDFWDFWPKSAHPLRLQPYIYIYLYIYMHAYNLIWWAIFRLQKAKTKRERWKNRARKGKDEKEEKTLKREKNPHLVCVCFLL